MKKLSGKSFGPVYVTIKSPIGVLEGLVKRKKCG